MNFSGKFGSDQTIWYPASGCRIYRDGSLGNVGFYGYYWSASPYNYYAYLMYFNYYRACGQSLRCIKE